MTTAAPGKTIAYILKGFPRLSETFIANEIHLLETMGLRLKLFSIKQGDEQTHAVVDKIAAPLDYCPQTTSLSGTTLGRWLNENWPHYKAANLRVLRRSPVAYLFTLMRAVWMMLSYRSSLLARPKKVFIKEFLQAAYIADQILDDPRIGHLHGHFCHGATTITWFISLLTGLEFSFTAHAKDIYQKQLNPGDLLEKKIRSSRFVVTCTGANHTHLSALSPAPDHVHTIYHGLDTGYFTPAPEKRDIDPPLILSVGRFVEKKGFDLLIEACASLKADGHDFHCIIVGEKGDAYPTVTRLIKHHKLEKHITLHRAVTQSELRELYHRATLFTLPCRIIADGDRDGIPNVMVEAMSCGLPCVSTRISGIPELVKHQINGLLIEQNDCQALAAALLKLLGNEALRTRLSEQARNTVLTDFNSRQTTLELQRLLQASLSTGRAAA